MKNAIIKKKVYEMKKYKSGEIVTGCVTGIEKYGVFVNLDEYYNGLIHISEISNNFVRNIHDYVKIGETIRAKVLEENPKEHHVKLSIKDIDYRITKKKSAKINETSLGFSTLRAQLDKWIAAKMNELEKNKVKK